MNFQVREKFPAWSSVDNAANKNNKKKQNENKATAEREGKLQTVERKNRRFEASQVN